MKKIALLGSANALKPQIIIETLIEMQLLQDKQIVFFTENAEGVCVDYCRDKHIDIVVFNNSKLDDKESISIAQEMNCDILVSCGWPNIVPQSFLEIFNNIPINCHGSILPDYRGSRSYMHYWANCEEFYGASIHFMNNRLDDGRVIVQGRLKQYLDETPEIIHRRTAELCAYLLPSALSLIEDGYIGRFIEGTKRYFYKLTHDEFVKYRNDNISKRVEDRILTPHKIL